MVLICSVERELEGWIIDGLARDYTRPPGIVRFRVLGDGIARTASSKGITCMTNFKSIFFCNNFISYLKNYDLLLINFQE